MKPTRQAALLVLLITALVVIWSGASGTNGDAPDHELVAQDLASTPESILDVAPTEASTPLPTTPPTPAPTREPASEPSPTPHPTTPEATERPPAPPTGVDDRAVIIERGPSGRQEVALTFDAGEGPGYTEEILDLLAQHDIRASFGITGQWAEQNPELVRRMVDEGHMIINHTYDHSSWTGASPGGPGLDDAARRSQLRQTEEIIRDIAGYEVKPYFRFTYADYDDASLVLLKEEGYDYAFFWTCDTMAWMGTSPEEIVSMCDPGDPEAGGPGAVILMHVAQEGDWEALPGIIDAYKAEGYDFVTLEQLVQP